jgi:hypothetical protein
MSAFKFRGKGDRLNSGFRLAAPFLTFLSIDVKVKPHCIHWAVVQPCTAGKRACLPPAMCLVLSLHPMAAAAAPAQPRQGAPPPEPDDGYGPPADPAAAEAMLLQVPGLRAYPKSCCSLVTGDPHSCTQATHNAARNTIVGALVWCDDVTATGAALMLCMSSLQGLQVAEQQFGTSSPQAADAAAQLGVLYSQVRCRVGAGLVAAAMPDQLLVLWQHLIDVLTSHGT